jgi:hypothetical protein
MSDEPTMRDLFDRWERVWQEGQYDLIPSCVEAEYIRARQEKRPDGDTRGLRGGVHRYPAGADSQMIAWFRFSFKWLDPKTGEWRRDAKLSGRGRQPSS